MFIANQGDVRQNTYPPRPYAQQSKPRRVLRPCYRCQGDHLVRDCPLDPANTGNNVPNMIPNVEQNLNQAPQGYCIDCGRKHLFQDCPQHLDRKGKATVNM